MTAMTDGHPLGHCPRCGAPGVAREKRLGGDDICERGHQYPSASATSTPASDHPAHLCGLLLDHPSRPAVSASIPTLAQAAPGLAADPSKSVLLYKVWREVFADYPDYPAQAIGDCTSFSHSHGHDLLETIEAYLGDLPIDSVRRTCSEAWYALGREVGSCLGIGDGCYNAAMLKAATTMGVACYGDLPAGEQAYSGRRAKQWGRFGAPDNIRALAANRKLQGAMIATTDEMISALQAGHPCCISTAHGFTMGRDQQGFCKLHGRWGHSMAVAGYRADRPGFLVLQSWGPDQPTGPTDLDQPSWSFWCTVEDMAVIVAEGDCDALAGTPGFAPRSLPGFLEAA